MSDTSPPYPADTRAKGWRFELDYEKIEQSTTWGRTKPEARPWLLMIWMVAWKQTPCGSFPDDHEAIAGLIGAPEPLWKKHGASLLRGWWRANDGRLYHDTISARVLEMMGKRRSDSDRQAARRAREALESGVSSAGVTRDTSVTSRGVLPESNTDHRPPTSEAKASSVSSPKARAAKKCPETFQPSEPQPWIDKNCPGLDWQRETEKFRDCTFKTSRSDWPGTWRNWMRKAFDERPAAGNLTYRERDAANAAARVHEMTGGLASAKPYPITRRNDALQEIFDAPRLLG